MTSFTKGTQRSAGRDITTLETITIAPNEKAIVKIDQKTRALVAVPNKQTTTEEVCAILMNRSSNLFKSINVLPKICNSQITNTPYFYPATTIDKSEVNSFTVYNLSNTNSITIKKGEAIAQVVPIIKIEDEKEIVVLLKSFINWENHIVTRTVSKKMNENRNLNQFGILTDSSSTAYLLVLPKGTCYILDPICNSCKLNIDGERSKLSTALYRWTTLVNVNDDSQNIYPGLIDQDYTGPSLLIGKNGDNSNEKEEEKDRRMIMLCQLCRQSLMSISGHLIHYCDDVNIQMKSILDTTIISQYPDPKLLLKSLDTFTVKHIIKVSKDMTLGNFKNTRGGFGSTTN